MLRSLAAAAARSPAVRRLLHVDAGCGGGEEVESLAYRMSMLRAPPVQRKNGLTWNSCSLIGRLDSPVRPYDSSSEEYPRAYTFLSVPPSSRSSSSSSSNFRLSLLPCFRTHPIGCSFLGFLLAGLVQKLNGDLANVCLKHLKHNDLVYVSGLLSSYHKVSASGERRILYKIYVMELNYVLDQSKKPGNDEDTADPASTPPANKNKYTDRLRLWQVFFASPHEWWDNRQSKPYIGYPDFKHKDTREKLWLHPDDPPWVRKQLELHDLKIAKNGHKDDSQLSKNHRWKAQDFNYSDNDEVQHSAEG